MALCALTAVLPALTSPTAAGASGDGQASAPPASAVSAASAPAEVATPLDLSGDMASPTDGREYATSGQVWDRRDLTYGFANRTADLSRTAQDAAIRRAFDTWEAASGLRFTEVPDCGFDHNDTRCAEPDIRIRFGRGTHTSDRGDPSFDGAGGSAAHTFGPAPDRFADQITSPGDIHFDDAELWRIDRVTDLQTVATHEIGHAVGLAHAPSSSCPAGYKAGRPIMCATVYGLQHDLATDDVNGVRALYGTWPPAGRVDVRWLGPRSVAVGSRTTYTVLVGNGHDAALRDVSFEAAGAPDCTRTSLPNIAPRSSTSFTCSVVAPQSLDGFAPGDRIELTATVRGDFSGSTTHGPSEISVRPPTNTFDDVPAWVSGAVDWAQHHGVASGYRDDTFRPSADITRAALVQMLHRLAGSPDTTGWPDHGFSDVPAWAGPAITWAAADPDGDGPLLPLVEGYPDGTFRPLEPITRAATSRVLFRFVGDDGEYPWHYLHNVPAFVEDAVRWGAFDPDGDGPLEEIIAGYPGRQFKPYIPITRAAAIRMVYRTSMLLGL